MPPGVRCIGGGSCPEGLRTPYLIDSHSHATAFSLKSGCLRVDVLPAVSTAREGRGSLLQDGDVLPRECVPPHSCRDDDIRHNLRKRTEIEAREEAGFPLPYFQRQFVYLIPHPTHL